MQSNHRSLLSKPWLGALALALGLACPSTARANSPFLVVPDPAVAEASPAYRYANMTDAEAFEELDRRKIIYSKVDPVPGVRAPIRLTSRLHGVYIHSALPPDQRVTSIFEILDARLALALDDFAALLERHDIDEVVHYTMYRPNVAAPDKDGHDAADAPAAPVAPAPAAPLPGVRRQRAGSKAVEQPAKPAPALAPAPAKGSIDKRAPIGPKINLDKNRSAKQDAKPSGRDGARGSKQKAPALAPKKPEFIARTLAPPKPGKGVAPPPAQAASPAAKSPVGAPPAAKSQAGSSPAVKSPAALSPAGSSSAPSSSPAASSLAKHRTGSVASARPAVKPFIRRGTWAPPGTRHPAGLAIDVGSLHKRDGRWLSVAQHFQGNIGDQTCGDGVTFPSQESAHELHSIVCEAYALGIFTYVLTPNYNEAHADHFHMEIKAGVRWFLYH